MLLAAHSALDAKPACLHVPTQPPARQAPSAFEVQDTTCTGNGQPSPGSHLARPSGTDNGLRRGTTHCVCLIDGGSVQLCKNKAAGGCCPGAVAVRAVRTSATLGLDAPLACGVRYIEMPERRPAAAAMQAIVG